MCGRFRLSRHKEALAERFGIDPDENWVPRYNLAPTQNIPVIRQNPDSPRRVGSQLRWGLIPSWAKDATGAFKMINARAETVAVKPAYRELLRRRRCLIPADGFYEWKHEGKQKIPFCFTLADGGIFAFAGLWDAWRSPEGRFVESCSILTTTPNALCARVHDRMPVILPDEAYDVWLNPGLREPEAVCDFLKPFDAARMRVYEVSRRVNDVAHDDPACAQAVERTFGAGFLGGDTSEDTTI